MALTLAVILLGKPLAALVIVRLLKYPLRVAISIAIALAQIGEFSFILAQAGKSLGLLDDRATNTLIAAAIASISLNPIVYRLNRPHRSPSEAIPQDACRAELSTIRGASTLLAARTNPSATERSSSATARWAKPWLVCSSKTGSNRL